MQNKLGLDFGNVIKPIGQLGLMFGFDLSLPLLKQLFGDNIYIVSRVDHLARGEQHVRDFMIEHKLYDYIPDGNLNFCILRSEKAVICNKLGITHFVDDRTEVLSHMQNVKHKYALNPIERQLADFPPKDMMVCLDWLGVMRKIENDLD